MTELSSWMDLTYEPVAQILDDEILPHPDKNKEVSDKAAGDARMVMDWKFRPPNSLEDVYRRDEEKYLELVDDTVRYLAKEQYEPETVWRAVSFLLASDQDKPELEEEWSTVVEEKVVAYAGGFTPSLDPDDIVQVSEQYRARETDTAHV